MRISDWSSDVCSSDLCRFDCGSEGDGIFERLASALGKILGHRVRGIAKQGCPAHCPMFDRVTVRCCPSPPGSRSIEHLVRQRVYTFEIGQYFIAAAIGYTPFLLLAAVEGNDKIVLPTAAQRIMDKVAMWSSPDHRRIDLQIPRHVLDVHNRTIDDVPSHAMLVSDDSFAYHRFDTIAADHHVRLDAAAVLVADCGARKS